LHLYDVTLCGFAVLSNHAHFLVVPADGQELARFMQLVACNISKAVGRLHDWRGAVWERRYRAIPVVDEASQVARLRYILAQGCAEGLVMRPEDRPGLHCARALLGREVLYGTWLDRSGFYHARRGGRDVAIEAFQTRYPVNLAALPCWAGLSAAEYRARCAELVAEIEDEARRMNVALGRVPMGARSVLAQHPHARPRSTNRSPAPLVHAATRRARDVFKAAYRCFVDAFRAAAERLRAGARDVVFPECSFPPSAPFVAGAAHVWLDFSSPP
jgi:hypothetical protein